MKKTTLLLTALLTLLSLSGCWPIGGKSGLIHNRENNYLQSKNAPDLKMPANVSKQGMNSDHTIPTITDMSPVKEPVSIDPPGSVLNPLK